MENFYLINYCDINKFRLYLNCSNSILAKKFTEINRNPKLTNKFVIVIEAIKIKVANKTQYNWETKCEFGEIYAIKVDNHRFYTLVTKNMGYRELFICRYGRKQSNKNDKKLLSIINSIPNINIQKLLQ